MSETLNAYVEDGTHILPGNRFGYKVIAVVGGTGKDWSAYIGLTHQSDDEIARNGDKLSQVAAEALFPVFVYAELRYRR